MRSLFIAGLAVVAVSAFAQESRPLGVSIRGGQFNPQGQEARAEDKVWTVGGIDFKIKDLSQKNQETRSLSVSIDFATKGDFGTIPITLNYVTRRKEWYYFGGLGGSFTSIRRVVGSTTERSESIELAYQLGLGYDFGGGRSPIFAELKYMGNGEDKLSAYAIMVGVRL